MSLLDPENTLSQSAVSKLLSALSSLKANAASSILPHQPPSSLMSLIFVNSRVPTHLNKLIFENSSDGGDFVASLPRALQMQIFDAKVSPLAAAVDFHIKENKLTMPSIGEFLTGVAVSSSSSLLQSSSKKLLSLELDKFHPFRPNLSVSRPELQLFSAVASNNNNNSLTPSKSAENLSQIFMGAAADKLMRILVSWKERRIRAEVSEDAPESVIREIPNFLRRINRDIAASTPLSSGGGNVMTATTIDEQQQNVLIDHITNFISQVELDLRVRRYITRILVGAIAFFVGHYLFKNFLQWRNARNLLKERIVMTSNAVQSNNDQNQQQEATVANNSNQNASTARTCAICLLGDGDDTSSSSSSSSGNSSGDDDQHIHHNDNNSNPQQQQQQGDHNNNIPRNNSSSTSQKTWIKLRCNHIFHLNCLKQWVSQGFQARNIVLNNLQQQQQQPQVQMINGVLFVNNNNNDNDNNINNNNNNDFSCSCPLCRRRDDEIALALEFCGDELAAEEKFQRRANRRAARISNNKNTSTTATILHGIKTIVTSMISYLTHFLWHDLQTKELFSFIKFLLVRIKSIFVFNTAANVELRVYALHLTYIFLPIISKTLITIYEQRDLIRQWWMATMRLRNNHQGMDDFISGSRTSLAMTSRFRAFEMNF